MKMTNAPFVDDSFSIDPRPYTEADNRLISEFITQQKSEKAKSTTPIARRMPTLRRKKVLA